MSRSQKQVRRVPAGSTAPQAAGTISYPGEVTQQDGATNIAGTEPVPPMPVTNPPSGTGY